MKEKMLKLSIIINLILLFTYFSHIIGLLNIFIKQLSEYGYIFYIIYFATAFIGFELMILSLIIFNLEPKLNNKIKILLLINLITIIIWGTFFFLFE
ncbi:MAG TPA: hypothetical protein PLE30_11200 [Candidatus Kapabacteria bacterium]|nr:hypothetical protein [Candidatus Kapabacteria bacterium]